MIAPGHVNYKGCAFCAHFRRQPEPRRPGRCAAPQMAPLVLDFDRVRDDPARCGESARWWQAAGAAP